VNCEAIRERSIMHETTIGDVARWYVIHTHPKQEDRACSNLKVLGVPIFNPQIRERRYNQFVTAPTYVTKPLFPRYIFVKFKINESYHNICFTRGICSVVSFGDGPVPIDEGIIALIQSNIKEDGFVRMYEEIRPGDKVIVEDGPLNNFVGVFVREMKDTDRIRILLEAVSYQAHIEIERDMVRKIS
jgi:transcriptional antiterminator RfaH